MVDAIGANGAKVERVTPVATTPQAASGATPPVATSATSASPSDVGALAKVLSAEAPVDADRVARIKRAIATGSFPILPATIADRLLALRLEWNSNDAA